ncbi:Transcriptional regulator, LacI family (fragment) [Paraburkholderia piptadeniae]|uniref:Transcriptional regulator, LacI family n=1 Tax=Paraburkholderia piptadeniae TaxID=1701573 RepID=A0A1N7S0R4_9BURK
MGEIASTQAPVVLSIARESYLTDQVSSDNYDGGRRAADYLVRCGRRHIALIGATRHASTIRDRERGFRDALDAAGAQLLPHKP